jgi:hypothetical protein
MSFHCILTLLLLLLLSKYLDPSKLSHENLTTFKLPVYVSSDHLILRVLIHMPIQVCEWANLGSRHIYAGSAYVILIIQSNTLSHTYMFMRIHDYEIQK